jgi:hypothetical protein
VSGIHGGGVGLSPSLSGVVELFVFGTVVPDQLDIATSAILI